MLAPILLFVYNRPGHTRRLLDSLLANAEAAQSPLYIYSDAPRDDSQRQAVGEVRSLVRQVVSSGRFATASLVERTENYGLARNVIDGVSPRRRAARARHRAGGRPGALALLPALYERCPRCLRRRAARGHIQACDFTGDPTLPPTFLIRWTGSWGWATWERAWRLFRPDGTALLRELTQRRLTRQFDFDGAYGYTRMLRRQTEGKNDSWAIRWNASLFLAGVLSLNVGRSLVQNRGFDGSGTNCGGGSLYDTRLWTQPLPVEKISPVEENLDARRALARYYRRTNGFWAKALRRIRRTLHGDFGR